MSLQDTSEVKGNISWWLETSQLPFLRTCPVSFIATKWSINMFTLYITVSANACLELDVKLDDQNFL